MNIDLIGYFTDANQTRPAYEPPLDGPCPFCSRPVTPETVRTINVMPLDRSTNASLFYYVHRGCHDAASEDEQIALDNQVMRAFGAWQSRGAS